MNVNVSLCILIGYALLLSAITWKASKIQAAGEGKMLNYLMAGQQLPTGLVAVMLAGLAIGGASTVGVAEHAYTAGFSAGWYNGAWAAGGLFVGLFLAARFRRMSQHTVPEMMGAAFGPKARLVGVVAQLLIMMTITALQYVAGGAILASMLPGLFTLKTGMIASAAVFIAITLTGGYWASGLTNVVNVVIIYVGIFAALWGGVRGFGGVENILKALPEGKAWFDPVEGIGSAILAAWMAVMITMACSTQAAVQIALSARDERSARNGFLLGALLIFPAGFLCSLFGIMAASQFPGLPNPTLALPTIAAHISPLIGGLFLAGLWAADVSTAVGLLMGSSTLLVQDVLNHLPLRSERADSGLLMSRFAVLFVSACSFVLSLTVVGILKTLTSGLAITTSFTLLILANLYAPRLCKRSAGVLTILASLVVWALWTWVPATRIGPHLIFLEWPVCLAVFALCAVLDPRPAGRLVPDDGEVAVRGRTALES